MDDNKFEGTICLVMATLVLFSIMVAPGISPVLAFLSLAGLSLYYLVIKKSYDYYDEGSN